MIFELVILAVVAGIMTGAFSSPEMPQRVLTPAQQKALHAQQVAAAKKNAANAKAEEKAQAAINAQDLHNCILAQSDSLPCQLLEAQDHLAKNAKKALAQEKAQRENDAESEADADEARQAARDLDNQ